MKKLSILLIQTIIKELPKKDAQTIFSQIILNDNVKELTDDEIDLITDFMSKE